MKNRLAPTAILAVVCVLLWWYHDLAVSYGLFGGRLALILDVAASLATAACGVIVVAELLIVIGFMVLMVAKPTGFERASVYAILCIVAFAIVLAHFGVAIATVLATSAVLTAIIGLALQPTLGALIAGLTLSADRVLKIGDGIIHGGEALIVAGIGWRSVSATRGDGSRVLISNARILDGGFEILPGSRPVRAEMTLTGPLAIEPQRIADILTPGIADISGIDVSRPITVAASVLDAEKAQARYRVRYWLRDFSQRAEIEEEILKRSWYAFQRHDVTWPVPLNFLADHNARTASLSAPAWHHKLIVAFDQARQTDDGAFLMTLSLDGVLQHGVLLLYGHGERIVMPDRVEGHHCLLINGQLRKILFAFSTDRGFEARTANSSRLTDLQRLTARLAERIGPYAEFAVHRAAMSETSLSAIRKAVACEIVDEDDRRGFMALDDRTVHDEVDGPGTLLRIRRGPTRELQADTLLRAVGRVAIVAIPSKLSEPSRLATRVSASPAS